MKAHNELFGLMEAGVSSLRQSQQPMVGQYGFRDLNREVFSGYLLKLAVDDSKKLSLWIGSTDNVTLVRTIWESRGIKATQSPDGSGATSSWIVIEAENLYTDGIFTSLATSICAKCIELKSTKRGAIGDALEEWREIFLNSSEGLNINELAGLLGELLTLEELALNRGNKALEYWHGFEGDRHDFSSKIFAVETKTKTSPGVEITINGLRQLEPPIDGQMALRFIRLEVTSAEELSLPGMVQRLSDLGISQGKLEESMLKAKASPLQISTATKYFKLLEKTAYFVRPGFPRIVPDTFEGKQCPTGVNGLKYQINLGFAESFKATEEDYLKFIDQL
jgi:hypothetical protein